MIETSQEKWSLLQGNDSMAGFSSAVPTIAFSTDASASEDANSDISDTFPVYIVGEVNRPGIYQIEEGMFLYQLVEMAGGLTQEAAEEHINLAYRISNNIMIRIPGKQEILTSETGGVAKGLLFDDVAGFENSLEETQESTKININSADETQLDQLPGIGITTAKRIIDYRNKNGNFKVIEDIMKIPGIKQSKFNKIKDQIVV
jgi:competence protein ComEA